MMEATPIQLRDVAPGKEPLALHNEDGSVWRVFDFDSRLLDAVRSTGEEPETLIVELLTEYFASLGYQVE